MDITGTTAARAAVPNATAEQPRSVTLQASVVSVPGLPHGGNNVTSVQDTRQAGPTEVEVKRALETVNKRLAFNSNSIEFSIDQDTGRTLIKIIDKDTETVIRQIPTEQLVEISKDLSKLQGLLLKDRA